MTFTAPVLPDSIRAEACIRLGKIEAQYDVTIIHAVESGSRAWGFPSPDSDNDVRFIYLRPLSHYVGLIQNRDVIEEPIDGVWDVNGWDIRKAFDLMVKGNQGVAEWLSSPLIYREYGPVPYKVRDLLARYASPTQSAKHYYGLANTIYNREIGSRATAEQIADAGTGGVIKKPTEVNQKKYLYAIRAAAAICWVEKYREVPPMTLPALMSRDTMSWDVRGIVNSLLERKATMGEFGEGPRIPIIDEFIEQKTAWVKDSGLDKVPINPDFFREANHLLLEALGIG